MKMAVLAFCENKSFLSNAYLSTFTLDRITYNCVEQFYQGSKAMYSGKDDLFKQIMHTESPQKQKTLANIIIGFHKVPWRNKCQQVMYTGLKAKFAQNEALMQQLLNTESAVLVAAYPWDCYWGAGAVAADINEERTWPGNNYLGKLLMDLRAQYHDNSI